MEKQRSLYSPARVTSQAFLSTLLEVLCAGGFDVLRSLDALGSISTEGLQAQYHEGTMDATIVLGLVMCTKWASALQWTLR